MKTLMARHFEHHRSSSTASTSHGLRQAAAACFVLNPPYLLFIPDKTMTTFRWRPGRPP